MNNKKKIISIIMSLIMFISMYFQKVTEGYNFILVLFFVLYALFIYKTDFSNKKNLRFSIFVSIALSLIFVIGRSCYILRYNSIYSIWDDLFKLRTIIYLFGNFSLFCPIVMRSVNYLDNINIYSDDNKIKHIWLKSFLFIFICYIPYFIIYYPGLITDDSITEISLVINNFANISNHHPVIHVLFCSIPFKIGMAIFKNTTIATACISFTQMIIMAGIYSYFIKFLYDRKINKKLLFIILLYFSINPVHAFYSITIWKDIIFSGCLLLMTLTIYKMLEKDKITFKNSYSFVIISILTIFFRNNALYMFFILSIFLIIIFRKQILTILPMIFIVFCVYFVVNGPVFKLLGVKQTSTAEYLAIPMQQIGRMAYTGVEFTDTEKKAIDEIIPFETLKKSYNPEIVDPIKFNKEFNIKPFEKDKKKYLNLYISLCTKHFDVASETFLISTLGYWYPNVDYWTVITDVEKNDIGINNHLEALNGVRTYTNALTTKVIPIYNIIWSIGSYILMILIAFIYTLKNSNKRSIILFIPIIGVWLTILIATPVFAEFRYMYSACTCLPFLILVPFMNKNCTFSTKSNN